MSVILHSLVLFRRLIARYMHVENPYYLSGLTVEISGMLVGIPTIATFSRQSLQSSTAAFSPVYQNHEYGKGAGLLNIQHAAFH